MKKKKKPDSETNIIHSFLYAESTFRTSVTYISHTCAHVCDMKGKKDHERRPGLRRSVRGGEANRRQGGHGRAVGGAFQTKG